MPLFKRRKIPEPTLAMVMIVRNEERFLKEHLIYHHFSGIERCYLFLHESDDRSEAIAMKFPWVTVFYLEGIPLPELNYISEIHRLAMDRALGCARHDGVDWLLILDADEIAFAGPIIDTNEAAKLNGDSKNLKTLFDDVPDWVVQVRLETFEAVPSIASMTEPFYKNEVFVNSDRFCREIKCPASGESVHWFGSLGHSQGQGFVRVDAPVRAYDSHRWTIMQDLGIGDKPKYIPLPTITRGSHAHFYIASPCHWYEKFSKHNDYPMHWPGEKPDPLEAPVKVWRETVQYLNGDRDKMESYCKESVFLNEPQIQKGVEEQSLIKAPALRNLIEKSLAQNPDDCLPEADTTRKDKPSPVGILNLSSFDPNPEEATNPKTINWSPALLEDSRVSGFYGLEEHDGIVFRWSRPDAEIRGYLKKGKYRAALETLYSDHPWELSAEYMGEAIKVKRKRLGKYQFSLSMRKCGEASLKVTAPALEPFPNDPRELAIPWVRFTLHRTD